MRKALTATIFSISLALSGVPAAPASAEVDGDALAGLIALLIFGAAIHELSDNGGSTTRNNTSIHNPPRGVDNWPGVHHARYDLPTRCLREFDTRNGERQIFLRRCMQNHYDFVSSLPDRCERRVHTDRGMRFGWSARCLDRAGYDID